jgi:hypothetical protein
MHALPFIFVAVVAFVCGAANRAMGLNRWPRWATEGRRMVFVLAWIVVLGLLFCLINKG